jgi:hypothetical protein
MIIDLSPFWPYVDALGIGAPIIIGSTVCE